MPQELRIVRTPLEEICRFLRMQFICAVQYEVWGAAYARGFTLTYRLYRLICNWLLEIHFLNDSFYYVAKNKGKKLQEKTGLRYVFVLRYIFFRFFKESSCMNNS